MPDSKTTTAKQDGAAIAEDTAFAPLHVLAERLASGELAARDLTELYLQRISRYDGKLHAFVDVYADEARVASETGDQCLTRFVVHIGHDHVCSGGCEAARAGGSQAGGAARHQKDMLVKLHMCCSVQAPVLDR